MENHKFNKLNVRLLSKYVSVLAVVGASAAFGFVGVAKADVINDGSFEQLNFVGWTVAGGPGQFNQANGFAGFNSHSGTYFAALGAGGSGGTISQTVNDMVGQQYTLSYWVQSEGFTGSFSASWDGTTIVGSQLTNPNSSSQYVEYSFALTGTGSDTLRFFDNYPGAGYIALDDVSLSPVAATPLPAALPMFAGGLGVVGFLTRRKKRKATV